MLLCLGVIRIYQIREAKPKRYMTPYNNMSCKQSHLQKTNQKSIPYAWAYSLRKVINKFSINQTIFL